MRKTLTALLAAGMLLGGSGSALAGEGHAQGAQQQASAKGQPKADKKTGEATYTCPMHPNVVQKGPGECPDCGMDLMPVDQAKK